MLAASLGRRPMDTTVPTLGSARFAVLETLAMDGVRERPARGFDDAPARLARSGAQIERCSFLEVSEAIALARALFTAEVYAIWGPVIEAAPHKMFPPILDRFRSGASVSAPVFGHPRFPSGGVIKAMPCFIEVNPHIGAPGAGQIGPIGQGAGGIVIAQGIL